MVKYAQNLAFANSIISSTATIPTKIGALFTRFLITSLAETSSSAVYSSDSEIRSGVQVDHKCFTSSLDVIDDKDLLRKAPNGELLVLGLIDRGAMEPDATLYHKLIKKCAECKRLKEGRVVHKHFVRSRFNHYVVPYNTLINMYSKCDSMQEAQQVFNEMPERDMVSWATLITGYSQNERAVQALAMFHEMLRAGFMPNEFTFGSVLKSAGAAPTDSMIGRQIHGVCLKYGYEENVYVGSALLDMYARCGQMEEAMFVFQAMRSKNEVSWNALIAGHARKGEAENAVNLFSGMKRGGFYPTHYTFSSIFTACACSGALEQGKWVHGHMIKSGLGLIAFVGNTLLNMYAKSGSINDAKKVFYRLVKKNIVSWNSMLTACAQHGLGMETVELFEEMLIEGLEPNEVTFLCVLTACSHSGLLDKGMHYFELMKKMKVEYDISHYVTIVDLLGRAGQLDRAQSFIKDMPIEPTAAIWKALLGACRKHKNMELGVFAAERVFELDPYDSGPHILLSNIYASAGRLSDAAKVRKAMNDSGVKKEPACSWLELENAVHVFVANDESHPHREEIRKMWKKMTEKIKEIGYVPDTSHALWFMDQQEREERLQEHSEKLALAFGLLNTPAGSTIRIKKNIRVCSDCHTAFKFVSKVVDREIILRDTNRFHHFCNGSCSCGDYW
ncbi:PREDICTED: pentatricopeptide repeat-containing protein At3g24000, mitochondrial isoform X1 [Ipomoea nil]|uniref:pentatricopeptide repeat-containing protein At3g24000, mitochondrial isoform X1 n=2 Tax=Ipomoea nil TaxID=35883 RepID=UPI000900BEC0|nr:PREDICTED: pentatricopeptide repeat-containing protein At3g24000, mitochondrial isoform X1 [Ipomoea nil]XP_019158608.1 PREDICTED: pentatricopeptide repeat-containing protein At3g24000, mitochondrial isoform X1 [Ipomoea nil]XP_019158609.1 PREDICTED: pentatricopeptide repeat-containing protein At3g24000, mitochondrial isoform X1 [Ipomoea nil]XP_019158610.1 PREDICTED: pentatricopeptide repeat-containing protein At3g24000, mitochondrial isoform X1 [Ipomoea nil]XP_019158611.1 PREDICTED: pentatric